MRKQLLFILFGLISVLASGQALKSSKDSTLLAAPYSTSGESYVIPWTPTDASVLPSPEAVWQNRYISSPVSYSTGTVQISIPLCHLPVKDIPLDVSLSYHTGGVKVDDVPGSVGLGWTLQAGGGISRVIHGHPDELHPFKMRTRQEVMQNNDLKYLKDLQHYEVEANYDRYYYHFDGHSGSFICHPSTGIITQLPPTENTITRIVNADGSFDFSIRTLSGTTYHFTEREHSSYEFLPVTVSAIDRSPNYYHVPIGWKLTRIVSPQGRDEVILSYRRIPEWKRIRTEWNASSYFQVDQRGTGTWNLHGYGSRLHASHHTVFPDQLVLSRITTSRFGSLEFTSTSITGGASLQQPNIRMASIRQIDCAGNVVRTIVFDNDHKELSGKLTLMGLTITDNGQLADSRTFTYYPVRSAGRSTKDFFGYSNAGLTGITSESVLDEYGKPAVNRKYHFDGAVGGALKSVAEATGAVTTYTYEPNTCHSFQKYPVTIGLRIRQISIEDPVSGKTRCRTFTYENPRCTIDFDQLDARAFISVSGHISGTGSYADPFCYGSSAVLTASCRIPGFRPEEAVIYYGKVSEEQAGTADTDTIRTVYEYDTSDCEHPFIPVAGGKKPEQTTTPERYLGEKLDCSNLSEASRAQRYTLFAAQSAGGYFRETAWEKAPLVRKVTYRQTDSGFEPAEEEIHTYELQQNGLFLTGFHSESLVRTVARYGLAHEDFRGAEDFHCYELTSITGRRYKTGTRHKICYTDGSTREWEQEYKYDRFARLYPVPSSRTGNQLGPVFPVFSDFPGFGQEARHADTQLPVAVITRCGNRSFAHYLCYSSNVSGGAFPQLVQAGMKDRLAMERWVVDETDTLTLKYDYAAFADGRYNLLQKKLLHGEDEVNVQDFTRYDSYGNLLEISVNHRPATSYVYGYRHSLPVAVIRGEGYDRLDEAARQKLESFSALSSFPEELKMILDSIRLRKSSLTDVYEHRPLVGISRHTKPNGFSTAYAYTGSRLQRITDTEGRTVSEYSYGLKAEGGDNFITTRTYLYGASQYREQTELYDGLGWPYFRCIKGATPSGKNLNSLLEYDNQLREVRAWLPVASSAGNATDFQKISREFHRDVQAFRTQTFDRMENGRLIARQLPGSDLSGKKLTTDYCGNRTDKLLLMCRQYTVTADGQLSSSGFYAPGELEVVTETDEDGCMTRTFTDYTGKVVLTRCIAENELSDTYYVYDLFGKLRYILTPQATELHSDGTWSLHGNSILRNQAYYYRYDTKYRLVEQKQPGEEAVLTKYDVSGAAVFTQDGNQRKRGVWNVQISDRHGRPALQGECPAASLPDISHRVVYATFAAKGQGIGNSQYQLNGMSIPGLTLKQVLYYDEYGFLGTKGFNGQDVYPQPSVSADGYLTGSVMHSEAGPVYSAFYYDPKGRLIRQVQSNLTGGYDFREIKYTFTGKPKAVYHTHTSNNLPVLKEEYHYLYDHDERLTEVEHTLGGTKVKLLSHTYDELGRLLSKSLHGNADCRQDYSYNLRSWLTGIKGNQFSQQLYYADGPGIPCYNGNISSLMWQSGTEGLTRGYRFAYDGMNRMQEAVYGEDASLKTNTDRFSEKVTGYDRNGNILGLQRYGKTAANGYGLIDNLTFTLTGNQLTRVDDASSAIASGDNFEFTDAVKQQNEYAYDGNGNLTKDLNKEISEIQYNSLNLPRRIVFGNSDSIVYVYAADGSKLRATATLGGVTTTTDYCSNVIYENGVQKLLLTEAGYVTLDNGKYHYYLRDHQGNNRVVVDEKGAVEEVNHYYPFGGIFASTCSVQPYKYNGKELENTLLWYDYGARRYDAVLGRWLSLDPSAEKYLIYSPYIYCKNNPILRIDLDGKDDYIVSSKGILSCKRVNQSAVDYVYYNNIGNYNRIFITDKNLLPSMTKNQTIAKNGFSAFGSTNNLGDATRLFKFCADHTAVEWKLDAYANESGHEYVIITDHKQKSIENGSFAADQLSITGKKVVDIHSHPSKDTQEASDSDLRNISALHNAVYFKKDATLHEYDLKNKNLNSKKIDSAKVLENYILSKILK